MYQTFHTLPSLRGAHLVIHGNAPLNKALHHIKLQSKSFLSPLFRRQHDCEKCYRESNENYFKH